MYLYSFHKLFTLPAEIIVLLYQSDNFCQTLFLSLSKYNYFFCYFHKSYIFFCFLFSLFLSSIITIYHLNNYLLSKNIKKETGNSFIFYHRDNLLLI